MTEYIPCHVLFQNPSLMEMDLTTFASCCVVDKEWRSFFRTLYPNFVSEQFKKYTSLIGIHVTETNTNFILPKLMSFLENIDQFMQCPTIEVLIHLHKMNLFKREMTEEKTYNTCRILLNILEYSLELSQEDPEMVCFRIMLTYKIYQIHEYIISSSFETYLIKSKYYVPTILERGEVIELQVQKHKTSGTDSRLLQMFDDLTRQIRYTRRILR